MQKYDLLCFGNRFSGNVIDSPLLRTCDCPNVIPAPLVSATSLRRAPAPAASLRLVLFFM